ncbi:Peptidase M14 like family protein [Spironucleus salmonicida]|uniref:Peptidase M14 like family protein n=1 Tax=Spironucleus salmonicida TaxID=348837 RepID=V6LW84_9EUKA|nr:Peptidase M14 like family protein [Spironucleus salmonicida]|eukprot:EST47971.1 hypothetical protein SS50377_11883 [Spironucleus salmonicida]
MSTPELQSEIMKHLLSLGGVYLPSSTIISQTRLPASVQAPWDFLTFDSTLNHAEEAQDVPENEKFTQQQPKLKSTILKSTAPNILNLFTPEPQCSNFTFNVSEYALYVGQQLNQQLTQKLPKDTVFHYLVSLAQKPFQHCKAAKSDIAFDAKFESSNLFQVFKFAGTTTYELYLFPDYRQISGGFWWFFGVQGGAKGAKYQFRINNFSQMRLPNGYRMLVFREGAGWHRSAFCGVSGSASRMLKTAEYYENILNENRNQIVEKVVKNAKNANVEKAAYSFIFDVEMDQETLYFASNYPYTYTQYINYANSLREFKFIKLKKLTNSECFNQVPFIEIDRTQNPKYVIVISARIHSQDTSGNYAIEGFIDFLLGRKDHIFEKQCEMITDEDEKVRYRQFMKQLTNYQQLILNNFVIAIFPLVNIDAVILGNSTKNFDGVNLNKAEPILAQNQTFRAMGAQIQKYVDQNLQITHSFDFAESISSPEIKIQTFEKVSNTALTQKFWQTAGAAGFLPFVDSAQHLQSYFDEESVSRVEQDGVSTDKLKGDQEHVAAAQQEVVAELKTFEAENGALGEFVLPALIAQFSRQIMQKYEFKFEHLSVVSAVEKEGFGAILSKKYGCRFAFKVYLSQFYGKTDKSDISKCNYFDIQDYQNFGITLAASIARQVKDDFELFDEILEDLQAQYANWLGESLKIAVTRQGTLSLLKSKDLGPSCQKMMKFKLWALAKKSDIQLKTLDKINHAIDLNLIFDLRQELKLLTDSEEEWDVDIVIDPEQVRDDKLKMSDIIKQWYPVPEKKKKKGKKGKKGKNTKK